jgi:hypothetical protein
VSAYVNAALFAFATMAPWLMTAVAEDVREDHVEQDEDPQQ